MIPRHIAKHILKYSKQYPLIALVGPRQSGKTTLARALFPSYKYISLENLDIRHSAENDPRGFLADHGKFLILDEVQRTPQLFSYLQELVDNDSTPAQYILTGSSQFLLMENITQSLAGRIVTFKLYPLTFTELFEYPQEDDSEKIFRTRHERENIQSSLYELLLQGFYPRVHDKHLDSYKWYEGYVSTYVERDIRSLLNVQNLRTFENFLKLCASQSAQLMNFTNISNAIGISVPTVKSWLSLLETSGIVFILPPYFENFSKRIVKTPKLYFADPGLLCYLLSIRNVEQLKVHPLLGSIFETFIIAECYKRFFNFAEKPPLFFWRDQTGNEIDLLIHSGLAGYPLEIKLSQIYNADFAKTISQWLHLPKNQAKKGTVIYCGEHAVNTRQDISATPWYVL